MKVMTPEHSLIDLAENPLDRSKLKSCFKDEKPYFETWSTWIFRRAMASLKKQLEIESKSGQDLGAGHSVGFEQPNIVEEKSVFVLCVYCEPFNIVEAKCSVLIIDFMFIVPSTLCILSPVLKLLNKIQYNNSLNSEHITIVL